MPVSCPAVVSLEIYLLSASSFSQTQFASCCISRPFKSLKPADAKRDARGSFFFSIWNFTKFLRSHFFACLATETLCRCADHWTLLWRKGTSSWYRRREREREREKERATQRCCPIGQVDRDQLTEMDGGDRASTYYLTQLAPLAVSLSLRCVCAHSNLVPQHPTPPPPDRLPDRRRGEKTG